MILFLIGEAAGDEPNIANAFLGTVPGREGDPRAGDPTGERLIRFSRFRIASAFLFVRTFSKPLPLVSTRSIFFFADRGLAKGPETREGRFFCLERGDKIDRISLRGEEGAFEVSASLDSAM